MSAETLRQAASLMRSEGDIVSLAVADWLDASAHQAESFGSLSAQALDVARAYLGETA